MADLFDAQEPESRPMPVQPLSDDEAKSIKRSADKVSDWLAAGCPADGVPRVQIALLVAIGHATHSAITQRRAGASVNAPDLSRWVRWETVEDGPRWKVTSGTKNQGMRGQQIGVISLKHHGDFGVVLQLDNGRVESFAPMQLMPDLDKDSSHA